MPELPSSFTGGCACGAVRYECRSAPRSMVNCHCRDCQRATGAACTPGVIIAAGALEVTGAAQTYTSSSPNGQWVTRAFCVACGSPLWSQNEASADVIAIKAASLDDPSWFAPRIDMWVSVAQPWAAMDPALPKHPGTPR